MTGLGGSIITEGDRDGHRGAREGGVLRKRYFMLQLRVEARGLHMSHVAHVTCGWLAASAHTSMMLAARPGRS